MMKTRTAALHLKCMGIFPLINVVFKCGCESCSALIPDCILELLNVSVLSFCKTFELTYRRART